MLSARKEAGKFSEGHPPEKRGSAVPGRAAQPVLALAQTEPEEKAERFQPMQQHGISSGSGFQGGREDRPCAWHHAADLRRRVRLTPGAAMPTTPSQALRLTQHRRRWRGLRHRRHRGSCGISALIVLNLPGSPGSRPACRPSPSADCPHPSGPPWRYIGPGAAWSGDRVCRSGVPILPVPAPLSCGNG